MESAPTILWKYICFFGGNMPPPYVMKLFSPLKIHSRSDFLFLIYRRIFVHRQIYHKSNRGNWGHLGGVWYKSITNIFLESHIVVQKCTTLSQMKKWIIKPWDKSITNEICKTAKHLKPCTNLSQIEKSHKKEVDCSTSFFVSLFWSNVDGTFIQQIT